MFNTKSRIGFKKWRDKFKKERKKTLNKNPMPSLPRLSKLVFSRTGKSSYRKFLACLPVLSAFPNNVLSETQHKASWALGQLWSKFYSSSHRSTVCKVICSRYLHLKSEHCLFSIGSPSQIYSSS